MIFALILIVVGVAVGLVLPLQSYAISSSIYTSVGILAAIDSIVGGIKASYDEEFDLAIFSSGLFLNTLMAVALSWVGDKIGVPLYFAAVFVFGTRLFNNLALIRRRVIERIRHAMEDRKSARAVTRSGRGAHAGTFTDSPSDTSADSPSGTSADSADGVSSDSETVGASDGASPDLTGGSKEASVGQEAEPAEESRGGTGDSSDNDNENKIKHLK